MNEDDTLDLDDFLEWCIIILFILAIIVVIGIIGICIYFAFTGQWELLVKAISGSHYYVYH